MPKNYSITWKIDDSQAQAAFKRGVKGMQDVEKTALSAVKAMEAAQVTAQGKITTAVAQGATKRKKIADDEKVHVDIGLHKLQVSGIKFQDNLSKTAKRGADDRAKIIDKAMADEHNRAVAALKRKESLEKGAYGRLADFKRRDLTQAEVNAAAHNKIVDAQSKKRIDAAMKAGGADKDAFALGIAGAFGMSSAVTGVGVAIAGLGAAKGIIDGIGTAFENAKKNAEGFGKTTLDFMVKLRPLASVMGRTPDSGFAREVAGFGVETGMGKDKASEFLENFHGRAQITKGKQISNDEYDKFTKQAGKLTTARGIPAALGGDLAASVLKIENFQAKGQGSNEAGARFGGMFDILDAGSGKVEKLAPQAQQLMAALASENELEGVFRNAQEVAVLTSVMAENNPEESAVFGRATIKALSQFDDKDRQPFYKRAGIEPGMPALERIDRANKVFEEEVGKGRPLESVLQGFGLSGDVREKTGLMTAYKARDTVMKPQMERMKRSQGPAGAAAVEAYIAKRFKDEDVQHTVAQARGDESELREGAVPLVIGQENAVADLRNEGAFDTFAGQAKEWLLDLPSRIPFSPVKRSGKDIMVDQRAVANARKQAGVQRAPGFLDMGVEKGLGMMGGSMLPGNMSGMVGSALTPFIAPIVEAIVGDNSALVRQMKRIADAKEAGAPKTPEALPGRGAPRAGAIRP